MSDFSILRGADTLIVLATKAGERAAIVYAGPDIAGATGEQLAALQTAQHIAGGPETPIATSLLNPIGTGHPSAPGLLAHRSGQGWAIDLRVTGVRQSGDHSVTIETADALCGVAVHHDISLCPHSGVARFSASLHNVGTGDLALEWCASICLPLDSALGRITSFGGKWAGEFAAQDIALNTGAFLRENRAGRTSHASFPGLYLGTDTTAEETGSAAALHLGWSGNHRLRVERLADGTVSAQAGELLLPGEIALPQGEIYSSPPLYVCWSASGYGDVTRRLHRFVRHSLIRPARDRPVHYNTWEAVYFDHSPDRLMALADAAAEVGAERFVLDDGWFGARRHDRAGLGDWSVSPAIYPDGLRPLADHVRSLGMEFGLWFEPEMVNPDSDLFRTHPDWVLAADGPQPIASRHQLPLDLTRSEVCDYLFERIDALIRDLGIAYIKWDMNRDIQHPGGADGRAVMHAQVIALYALIARIRTAHPALVIESCSSGGARADYGIVQHTDRVWTSDNNDARRRYAIMRGASHFLPLEMLGNHVGPKRCHITGRMFSMQFRAGTAIFGHMGMELDLAEETPADRAILAAAIALHKQHRDLIHSGEMHRLAMPDFIAAQACVASDRAQALTCCALLDVFTSTTPPRLKLAGLDPAKLYRTRLVWPECDQALSTPSVVTALDLTGSGFLASGAALMDHGMQLPLTHPDTCLIFHSEAVND